MVKATCLALLLLIGCAHGVATPAGVQGYAFGQAKIEYCGPAKATDSSCDCARIEGGSLSVAMAGIFTTALAATVAYFGLPF